MNNFGNYNPVGVMLNGGASVTPGTPYTTGSSAPVKGTAVTSPSTTATTATTPQQNQSQVLPSQTIRATGTGPFDNAYRQNLATYAGGLFQNPGNLSFNPTGNLQDLGGQQVGGGNAPLYGGPQSLLNQAIGGQGFSYQAPQPAQPSQTPTPAYNPQFWQQFLGQYSNLFGNQRMGA